MYGERLELGRTKEERWRLCWRRMANGGTLRANGRGLVAAERGSWLKVVGKWQTEGETFDETGEKGVSTF